MKYYYCLECPYLAGTRNNIREHVKEKHDITGLKKGEKKVITSDGKAKKRSKISKSYISLDDCIPELSEWLAEHSREEILDSIDDLETIKEKEDIKDMESFLSIQNENIREDKNGKTVE